MAQVIECIAGSFDAMGRADLEWPKRHKDRILAIVKEHMPSGSGFDSGTSFDFDKSKADKMVFNTYFHHMNDGGYYDGWTEHSVIVTPAFRGYHLRVTGKNKNDIKDCIGDVFYNALSEDCEILA